MWKNSRFYEPNNTKLNGTDTHSYKILNCEFVHTNFVYYNKCVNISFLCDAYIHIHTSDMFYGR